MAVEKVDFRIMRGGFAVLPQDSLDAIRQSDAIAMWAYLMSRPEHWVVRPAQVKERLGIGQDRYAKAARHLREVGLLETVANRDASGQVSGRTIVVYSELQAVREARAQAAAPNTRESGASVADRNTGNPEVRETPKVGESGIYSKQGSGDTECPLPLANKDLLAMGTGDSAPAASRAVTLPGFGDLPAPDEYDKPTAAVWGYYASAYRDRYGIDPVRNAKVNGQLSHLIRRIPASEAPHVAAYFVRHPNAYYVRRAHSVDCLLSDAEKLRMEWATQRMVTNTEAQQEEQTAARGNVFRRLIDKQRAQALDPQAAADLSA
jgi:hypothetical protein